MVDNIVPQVIWLAGAETEAAIARAAMRTERLPNDAVLGRSHFARERVELRWRTSSDTGTIGRGSTQGSGKLSYTNTG